MVSRIIDQYVDSVTQQMPIRVRKAVEDNLKNVIYEKLDDYTDGQRAVSRDVRAVLNELGSPDEVADIYYQDLARKKGGGKRRKMKRPDDMSGLLLGVSAVLIILGMILLIGGVTSNVFMLVTGALVALGVTCAKLIGPAIDQMKADDDSLAKEGAAASEEDEFFWGSL